MRRFTPPERPPARRRRGIAAGALALAATTAATLSLAGPADAQAAAHGTRYVTDPASTVSTLAGTGTGGDTVGSINNFPGPSVPFGMVQFSPDNPGTGQGYYYGNSTLRGFGLDHASQGCGALGDFPVLPTTTSMAASAQPWTKTESYTHDGEEGSPGYYRLVSKDAAGSSITSELTASTRTGVATFTFPEGTTPSLTFRSGVSNSSTRSGSLNVNPKTGIITGWTKSGNFCGKNNSYTAFFAAKVDQGFASYGAWDESKGSVTVGDGSHDAEVANTKAGGYVSFPAGTRTVHLKIALSYVSTDNAILNMNTEVPTPGAAATGTKAYASWDAAFDGVRTAAHDTWNDALGKVQVSDTASATETSTFYHSLYRSLLHPNTFDDVNGQYLGFEKNPVVHDVSEHPAADGRARHQYAYFSDWDTYRTLAPLQAMLFPDEASDMAQSLVNDAEQSGSYPRWAFANAGTNQMSGDNPAALIAQTYAFGARDFDVSTALDFMVKGAVGPDAGKNTGGTNDQAVERFGAEVYNERHYAPQTKEFQTDHAVTGGSITEEYSIDDFAVGQLANALGQKKVARTFQARSSYWQNLFNPTTRYVSLRDASGAFPTGDGLTIPDDFGYRGRITGFGSVGYDEGNAEQYVWLVPQNVKGLVTALGGNDVVAARLDDFMTHGLNVGANEPYMWAGNEPDFFVPWLYSYVGKPWRTSEVVDEIRTTLFGTEPDKAEPGNDDLGAQSSWYVWAALGLFPTTPGTDVLTVNAPAFDAARIHLGDGRTVAVTAAGANEGKRYVRGLSVQGSRTNATYLKLSDVERGGDITFTLGKQASRTWGTRAADAPPSYGQGSATLALHATPDDPAVRPGSSTRLTVDVQRFVPTGRKVRVSATSDVAGIRVTSGTATLDHTGAGSTILTLRVKAGVADGYYPVHLSAKVGGTTTRTDLTVRVAAKGGLLDATTVVGTSSEDAVNGSFDGAENTFSRDSLASVGLTPGSTTKLSNGTTLTWPSAPEGFPDTVAPSGQTVRLSKPARTISFVGAGINGGGKGTATVRLSDGSTATADFSFGDWVLPSSTGDKSDGTLEPVYGNSVVAWTPVRNASSSDPGAYVFATTPYTAPAGTKVVSVTLPTTDKARVFSIARR
ncbi:Alpha-L-fucosidase [Luteimicrobium xylanilyticum]|uniref:Alpha-L-fucosidase n=1 Tax=Luteimicrobium xylanilyticum TaxID=1133546 RepID=A0A5P9QBU7_9MICO|nr:GH92 family glycosyl hydrolase [Luteimicrobium xylanilyticum]QFU98819.1 Alpha-L-fucosidase [Luteimicrobium xylanilyticum]